MVCTLKLLATQRETKKGFPIVLEIFHDPKNRPRKIIGHSKLEHWNEVKETVLDTHPDYDILTPKILTFKNKIKTVIRDGMDFEEANRYLFGAVNERVLSLKFYDAALKFCEDNANGRLRRSVLKSWNDYYPNITTNKITKSHAEHFMQHRLAEGRDANGVHAYMRTLNALYNLVAKGPENPFTRVRPKLTRTPQLELTNGDMVKIFTTCTISGRQSWKLTPEELNKDRDFYKLMFLLGGIYVVDLANLRYDKHVIDSRVQFNRFKGGTDTLINNIILPEAWEILDRYKEDSYPYLVPIATGATKYRSYANNFAARFGEKLKDLNLTRSPKIKSARYTFINRAQQLLIDQRITMELVGHEKGGTHGIYTNEFPLSVRDEAHKKIVDLKNPEVKFKIDIKR